MLAAVLFTIGAVGLLIRRNVLVMFMCVELMLNAVNLTFVTFARMLNDIGGQVVVFFVLVVAAAEVVVGLGIIVAIFRRRPDATADDLSTPEGLGDDTDDVASSGSSRPSPGRLRPPAACRATPGRPLRRMAGHHHGGRLVRGAAIVCAGLYLAPPATASSPRPCSHWVPVGGLKVDLGFLVDPLSITMALFVTGVGTLIHLYSIGYMHGDARYPKFFVYLNLFAFSMLMLVLGDNLLVTFLGWEGVGACSYFLISFWFERRTPPPSPARRPSSPTGWATSGSCSPCS